MAEVVTADILKDFSEVDRFVVGQQQLSRLVGPSVELGVVAKSIKSLKIIDEQLTKIDNILEKIRAAVGKEATDHLLSTVSGFAEFIIFIDLVSDLNSSYWRLRDERFDNEELDDLLPKLCNEIEQLRVLHDDLHNVFHLDTLPTQETLREIRVALDTGGVFRWFKSNWRTVRKQALDLAASSQISFTLLYSLLGKAEEYSERCKALAENTYYKRVFGNHLKGLETDLVALEALRDWYKKVRQQYGVGFTQKAALGSAVLELPLEIIRAVHSLSDQGVQRQLNNFLEELVNIKKVFSPVSGLQNDKTLLVGNKGILSRLLAALNKALLSCKPLLTDNAVSTVDLAHRIELLVSLKKAVGKLEAADYDNKLFQGSLGLQLGADVDNSSALSMLRNTLVVAEIVDQQLPNVIQQRIYAQPEASTFEILLALLEKLRNALDFQAEKYSDVEHITKLDSDAWMKLSGDSLDALLCRNDQALRNGQSLQNWLDYVRVRNQVKAMGLGRLATLVEQGNIEIQQVYYAHKAGLFDLLAREIFREQPEWGHFSGRTQETLQEHFRTYDNRLKKLQCEKIAWQIDQIDIPAGHSTGRVSTLTELALLRHECSKKNRYIPIRQLLQRARDSLVALKPCFMMGPMSVAQYLKPGQIEFDLVVMDEASQIKPQDALGAIARGKQLVVVGDPKQLPPTSFFAKVFTEDDENNAIINESESILDATLPMFPARRLRWHYRSQHESLIAFSNHSFYGSDLVLFPSPCKESDRFGIQYSRVQSGCFIDRRNMEEARVIAEAVRDHFRHQSKESLGVVAMSAGQRLQIETAVEALSKEDNLFQEQLAEDAGGNEHLFIKNLENVQGDERDVIFISMTYGSPEPGGKVFQRFGPINSDVGWRRLNVLFTRSKKECMSLVLWGRRILLQVPHPAEAYRPFEIFLPFVKPGFSIQHKEEAGDLQTVILRLQLWRH